MDINANTKISKLIKANPDSIEAIASINKHFLKLKNPILRKLLATRVTIADAAKIGGVDVETFFKKLKPLGFTISNEPIINQTDSDNVPETTFEISDNIIELDVRPILETGVDPFKEIMKKVNQMNEGETLKIINTFEPIPLINLLSKKGFKANVERPDDGSVITYLTKDNSISEEIIIDTEKSDIDFDEMLITFKVKTITIDVRALEMPEPMIKILSTIETLPPDHILYVKHKKFPKFLIPELKKRDYFIIDKRIDDHNIDLIIYKPSAQLNG